MNLQTAKGLLYDNPYTAYAKHDLLFSLSVIFEEDDCDTEIVFAVPAEQMSRNGSVMNIHQKIVNKS